MSNLRAIICSHHHLCCRLQPHHHHQAALLLYDGGRRGSGVPAAASATTGSIVIGRSRGFSVSVSVSIHQNPGTATTNTSSRRRGRRRLSSPPPCASASSRFHSSSSSEEENWSWRRTPSPSSLSSISINHQRKRATFASVRAAANWADQKSPYDTLELERDADDEKIKLAYRRLAKFYHPDVYDGRGTLEEGETAEARFIKIQAAYELLIDGEKRRQYDMDNRVNPMKASQAWMEWLMKKRKAFDQRGDMAIAAWAEQQQRELNLRVRRASRSKIDPDEERRILAREKKASLENFNNTLKRHTLVLRKRDLLRKKAEEEKQKLISKLLAAEGLELAVDKDEDEDEGEASP